KYEKLRGEFNNSDIVYLHSFGDFGNWEKLLEQTTDNLKSLQKKFPEVQQLGTMKDFHFSDSKKTNDYVMPYLNQILYGPPGTGKTYETKKLAVQIANPEFSFKNVLDNEKD